MKNEDNEEIANFLSLLKEHNYPLFFFSFAPAKEQLPEDLLGAFNDLLQSTKMGHIDLIVELKSKYSPDKQKNIPHVFDSIDATESLNIVKNRLKAFDFDKDGLLLVPTESMVIRDGFEFGGHYLIFPEFLRDHGSLLDWIAENRRDQWELKFLIDHDFLGKNNTVRTNLFSKAHFFGPKTIQNLQEHFKGKVQSIFGDESFYPDRVEITLSSNRGKNKSELHLEFEELFHYPERSLDYLENSCEINNTEHIFYTRFAHTVLDNKWKRCRHLDLSIRSYKNLKSFSKRIESHIAGFGRHQQYVKLLKIESLSNDYSIPYEEVICRYFSNNPYILEFFEGVKREQDFIKNRRNLLVFSLRNANILSYFPH